MNKKHRKYKKCKKRKGIKVMNILNKFGSVFSNNFVVMLIIIALIIFAWDLKVLDRKKRKKEYIIAKVIGIVYVSAAIVLFIVGKIV
jgi:hypothetical protein